MRESEAPIIPKATTYHGDFLLPMKNVSLFALLEVREEIITNTAKYIVITIRIMKFDIYYKSITKLIFWLIIIFN